MDKVTGKVICKIAEILSEMDTDNLDEGIKAIKRILAIKEIALVDREAKPPKNPFPEVEEGIPCRQWEHNAYAMAQQDMLDNNWGKEVAK